tara:strand:- start:22 stop:189 length:168 start_codon:yes stop_codon:yes gene_type:complete
MWTRIAAPEHKTEETHTGLIACVVLLEFLVAIVLMQLFKELDHLKFGSYFFSLRL